MPLNPLLLSPSHSTTRNPRIPELEASIRNLRRPWRQLLRNGSQGTPPPIGHDQTSDQFNDPQRSSFEEEVMSALGEIQADDGPSCTQSKKYTFKRQLTFIGQNNIPTVLEASIDSGCKPANFIDEVFVRDFLKLPFDKRPDDAPESSSVTHQKIKVIGEICLRYTVGNHANVSDFLVAEGSAIGLILGEKEIQKYQWLIEGDNDSVAPVQSLRDPDKPDETIDSQKKQKDEIKAAEDERQKKEKERRLAAKAKKKDPQQK